METSKRHSLCHILPGTERRLYGTNSGVKENLCPKPTYPARLPLFHRILSIGGSLFHLGDSDSLNINLPVGCFSFWLDSVAADDKFTANNLLRA